MLPCNHPLLYLPSVRRARQSKYVSRVIIFFIWTVALVLASPMLLMLGVVDNEYVTIRKYRG